MAEKIGFGKKMVSMVNAVIRGVRPKKYECRFMAPGLTNYPGEGGKGEEMWYLSREVMDRMKESFVGCPVVVQEKHNGDSTPDRFREVAVGVVAEVETKADGWDWCKFIVWDEDTQKKIENDGWNVSCAYNTLSDLPGGVLNAIKYDHEVGEGEYIHLAIVDAPRQTGARILLNSVDREVGGVILFNMNGKTYKLHTNGKTALNNLHCPLCGGGKVQETDKGGHCSECDRDFILVKGKPESTAKKNSEGDEMINAKAEGDSILLKKEHFPYSKWSAGETADVEMDGNKYAVKITSESDKGWSGKIVKVKKNEVDNEELRDLKQELNEARRQNDKSAVIELQEKIDGLLKKNEMRGRHQRGNKINAPEAMIKEKIGAEWLRMTKEERQRALRETGSHESDWAIPISRMGGSQSDVMRDWVAKKLGLRMNQKTNKGESKMINAIKNLLVKLNAEEPEVAKKYNLEEEITKLDEALEIDPEKAIIETPSGDVPLAELVKVYEAEKAEIDKKEELDKANEADKEEEKLNMDSEYKGVKVSEMYEAYKKNQSKKNEDGKEDEAKKNERIEALKSEGKTDEEINALLQSETDAAEKAKEEEALKNEEGKKDEEKKDEEKLNHFNSLEKARKAAPVEEVRILSRRDRIEIARRVKQY